jgi:hypothetical protein
MPSIHVEPSSANQGSADMTVHTAACTPPLAARPVAATAPSALTAVATVTIKVRETFAALNDIQWRAPWDEPGRRWINLR